MRDDTNLFIQSKQSTNINNKYISMKATKISNASSSSHNVIINNSTRVKHQRESGNAFEEDDNDGDVINSNDINSKNELLIMKRLKNTAVDKRQRVANGFISTSSNSSGSSIGSGNNHLSAAIKGNKTEMDKKIKDVCDVTGCSRTEAKELLERSSWNVVAATDMYFETEEQDLSMSLSQNAKIENGLVMMQDGTRQGAGSSNGNTGNVNRNNNSNTKGNKSNSLQLLGDFFNKYASSDNANEMDANGIAQLCEDIQVDSDDPVMLLIAYKCKAERGLIFTKDEWIRGMQAVGCNSVDALKATIPTLKMQLEKDNDLFRQVYLFAFDYIKYPNPKSLPLESALELWRILLPNRFVLLAQWLEYVSKNHKHSITKDEWRFLPDFARTVPVDDPSKLPPPKEDSAMPTLIDSFTEWFLSICKSSGKRI